MNLIYDHRIPADRAMRFMSFMGPSVDSVDSDALVQALFAYRKEWIARQPHATFLNRVENLDNWVYDLAPGVGLSGDLELVNVCNITQKLLRIGNPRLKREVARLGLGRRNLENGRAIHQALRTTLYNQRRRKEFVEDFLRLLDLNRQTSPWHPVWVAGWTEFSTCIDRRRPESWLEAVGLPCPPEPNWLIVLRYPTTDAQHLYRPTQLEAGAFPWHFPSPKTKLPPLSGGHPMNLAGAPMRSPLCSEFVHEEIPFRPAYWEAGGELLHFTGSSTSGFLMGHRRLHYRALCAHYGVSPVVRWMPDPVKLPD